MRVRAALLAALLVVPAAAAPPAPSSAPPGVEIAEDGSLVHRPSGLKLPREVRGPRHTHRATLHEIGPNGVVLSYGAITLAIGTPQMAADPRAVAPGFALDDDLPGLPALLLWGESAAPVTVSWLNTDGGKHWMSFALVSNGWQFVLSSSYTPDQRDTVVRTAEAVWAILASGNERSPR